MHLSDGVVSLEVVVTSSVISAIFLYRSFTKMQQEEIPLAAAMSALFFIASFIHIPLGPTQIHLVLIGLIGIFLKEVAFLSIFIALLLQALLLGFGGISSLGVNVLIMGLPAVIIGYLYQRSLFQKVTKKTKLFLVGFLGVFFASSLMAMVLFLSGEEYFYTAIISIFMNIPAMVLEGIITLFLIEFIKKTMPNLKRF